MRWTPIGPNETQPYALDEPMLKDTLVVGFQQGRKWKEISVNVKDVGEIKKETLETLPIDLSRSVKEGYLETRLVNC